MQRCVQFRGRSAWGGGGAEFWWAVRNDWYFGPRWRLSVGGTVAMWQVGSKHNTEMTHTHKTHRGGSALRKPSPKVKTVCVVAWKQRLSSSNPMRNFPGEIDKNTFYCRTVQTWDGFRIKFSSFQFSIKSEPKNFFFFKCYQGIYQVYLKFDSKAMAYKKLHNNCCPLHSCTVFHTKYGQFIV